jgi:hypothetical protein
MDDLNVLCIHSLIPFQFVLCWFFEIVYPMLGRAGQVQLVKRRVSAIVRMWDASAHKIK